MFLISSSKGQIRLHLTRGRPGWELELTRRVFRTLARAVRRRQSCLLTAGWTFWASLFGGAALRKRKCECRSLDQKGLERLFGRKSRGPDSSCIPLSPRCTVSASERARNET